MRRARDGAQGHRNGPRNNNIETEADKRLRTSLIEPELTEQQFYNTLTDEAALNLRAYRRHFRKLHDANIASEIAESLINSENLNVEKLPEYDSKAKRFLKEIQKSSANSSNPLKQVSHMLKNYLRSGKLSGFASHSVCFSDVLSPDKIAENSQRSIAVFTYEDGVSHSSAFLRYAPSLATIISALPRMISRRKAFLSSSITVDEKAMLRRDMREENNKKRQRDRYGADPWYKKLQAKQAAADEAEDNDLVRVLLRVQCSNQVRPRQLTQAAERIALAEGVSGATLKEAMAELDACMPEPIQQNSVTEAADMAADGSEVLGEEDLARFVDVGDDVGGSRQEVDITPGCLCWISAVPSKSLPIIPSYVLAEQGVGNIGHNLVQASLAANGHRIAMKDVTQYRELSARAFLSNHFWTPMKNHISNLGNGSQQFSSALTEQLGQVEDCINIPIPTPLCPLEGLVLEVDKKSALVEVKMPLPLAHQWFPAVHGGRSPSCRPAMLATDCDDVVEVTAMAKHHIVAQTKWPLRPPENVTWMLVAGPQDLMHKRITKALETLTTKAFTGSDAVRHAICRMDGLPLMDPFASARALKRILGLNSRGYYVPGKGEQNVLERLRGSDVGNKLLAAIGAPLAEGVSVPTRFSEPLQGQHQWMRLHRLAMESRPLMILKPHLRANEVGCFATQTTLLDPVARLERNEIQVTLDKILCERLRHLEFERESYMPTDDVNGDKNTDVEEIVPVSKAGRFYFRRQYVAPNQVSTAPDQYVWHSTATNAPNTRITHETLSKCLQVSSFTYQKCINRLLAAYQGAPPQKCGDGGLDYPTESQRVMHPQANHNPLSVQELSLAQQILEKLPQLNPSQRRAIMLALNQSLTLIQGPPGTGKTQTITALVWLWVCAMGANQAVRDAHLPFPNEYLASISQEENPVAELQRAPEFVASPRVDIENLVKETLTSPQTIEAVLSPKVASTSPQTPDDALETDENTIDLRTEPEQPPTLPKSSAEVLQPLNVSGRGPVLVSAFTNVAIDEICARLLTMPGFEWEEGKKPLHTIVRIGNSIKVDPRVEKARFRWHLAHDAEYLSEVAKLKAELEPAANLSRLAQSVVDTTHTLFTDVKVKATQIIKENLSTLSLAQRARINKDTEDEMIRMVKVSMAIPAHLNEKLEKLKLEPLENQVSISNLVALAHLADELRDKYRREDLLLQRKLMWAQQRAEHRALAAASVVVGTCMGVGSSYLNNCRFSLVVVDECSQVPELACLLPISKLAPCDPHDFTGDIGASSSAWEYILSDPKLQQPNLLSEYGFMPSKRSMGSYSRVVLVGDQCQLPPTVESEIMKLSGVHISLFERLISSAPQAATSLFFSTPLATNNTQVTLPKLPRLAPRTALLHTQYRMNPALATWISSKVYSNRITSGTHALHRKSPPGFPWPVAITRKAETSAFEGDPAEDPLTRAVVSQMLALEDLVRTYIPNADTSRFAEELRAVARANANALKSRKGWVPHRSLKDVSSKDLLDMLESAEEQSEFLIEEELASYVAQRIEGEGSGNHRGMNVRYATGSGASLVKRFPIVFIDMPYKETPTTASKSNIYESDLAVHIAASLIGALPTLQDVLKPELKKMFETAAANAARPRADTADSQSADASAAVGDNPTDALAAELSTLSLKVESQADEVPKKADSLHELVTRTWLRDAVKREQGHRVNASEVGIVTPYVGQVQELKNSRAALCELFLNKNMASKNLADIEVKSIDGFQGREKEVIIMSCVRSNVNNSVGFLADLRRLNVAVSRAKRGLILIGNVKTLMSHSLWASYIGEIKKAGAIVPYARLKPWLKAGVALPDFL